MRYLAAPLLALSLPAYATAPGGESPPHPEATSFAVSDDAEAEVDAALERARSNGKRVLLVFGANWCHDSRALAGWLTSDGFEPLLRDHFELVFIDIGSPQTGKGRNLDLAARFGVTGIEGSPNLLVIDSNGALVNTPESARGWRNAASRSEEAIYAIIESYAGDPGASGVPSAPAPTTAPSPAIEAAE